MAYLSQGNSDDYNMPTTHAPQIDFLQSGLYQIWKLQEAENRNNFSNNSQDPFLKSALFLRIPNKFLWKNALQQQKKKLKLQHHMDMQQGKQTSKRWCKHPGK